MKSVRTSTVARAAAIAPVLVLAATLSGCTPPSIDSQEPASCDAAHVQGLEADLQAATDASSPTLDPVRDDLYRSTLLCEEPAEGATVVAVDEIIDDLYEPDHGFTWDPDSGEIVTAGFAVSPHPENSVTIEDIPSMSAASVEDAIESFASDNADLLADANSYLGGWHDPDTGTVWLDISIVTDSADEARTIATDHDQLAFFDLQMLESIDTESTDAP